MLHKTQLKNTVVNEDLIYKDDQLIVALKQFNFIFSSMSLDLKNHLDFSSQNSRGSPGNQGSREN
jgi:hypothetical protein